MILRLWKHRSVAVAPDLRTDEEKLLDWLAELPEGEARAIRSDAGWTQTQVAEFLGVVPSHVSRWERGARGWGNAAGVKYARLLRDLSTTRLGEVL